MTEKDSEQEFSLEPAEDFYSRNAERMAENYGEETVTGDYSDFRDRFVEMSSGGRVLDAGCGPGRDTEFFESQGLEAFGVDLAEGMIEYAKENREGSFLREDLRELEFEPASFDGIWCASTIFFLEPAEMERVLEKFHSFLDEDGALYVDFKVGDGEFEKERWGSTVKEYRLPAEQCREMVRENGFKIVREMESEAPSGHHYVNLLCRKC